MPTVHFLGKIVPEGVVKVTIDHKPIVTWTLTDASITGNFIINVRDSLVDVEISLNAYRPDLFADVYIRALDLSRGSIHTVAFAMGYGLNVLLEKFIDPAGTMTLIAASDDTLPALSTAVTLQTDFDQVHSIVLTDTSVRHALNDLIQAITLPHVGPVNSALAMDRLKHLIAPELKDPQAWKKMRDVLQIDEPYLKYITDASKSGRHGRPDYIPGTITTETLHRAWTVMNRYLEYRKRNAGPLPTSEFPLLDREIQCAYPAISFLL